MGCSTDYTGTLGIFLWSFWPILSCRLQIPCFQKLIFQGIYVGYSQHYQLTVICDPCFLCDIDTPKGDR